VPLVCGGDRDFDRAQDLSWCDCRFIDASEKVLRGDTPLAGRARQNNRSLERNHAGGKFGGRVGIDKAAADRPTIADRRMGNMPGCFGEERRVLRDQRIALDLGMARQCADAQRIAVERNALQLLQIIHVDQ
jgi:hypothetical protein